MQTAISNKHTIDSYLSLESESDNKHEFHNGEIFALAGGTIYHGIICTNVNREIGNQLEKSNSKCITFSSEVRLFIESANSFVYPDSMVVCDKIEKSTVDKNSIVNPTLIVEVLSKSTAGYDRGDKFYKYRTISTLQEYVLIDQEKKSVDVYYRKSGNHLWSINRFDENSATIELQSLGIQLDIERVYANVEFEE